MFIRAGWHIHCCIPDPPLAYFRAFSVVQSVGLLSVRVPAAVQGWLPKRGEQYGGDWVLYQRHPEVEHADYVVRCVCWPQQASVSRSAGVRPEQASVCQAASLRWPELTATIRVAGQVRKRLVLLYVQFPADADLTGPDCMQHAKVCCPWHPGCGCEAAHTSPSTLDTSLASGCVWMRVDIYKAVT